MNENYNILIDQALLILNSLHFIRSDWFYAFIPLALYLIIANRKTQSNRNWFSVIDKQLLPFVLTTTNNKKQRRYPLLLIFIAASLCITALAGPVYKKLAQPVYRELSSLIILMDLSQSMNAADIKSSRLSRAKLELLDILKTRKTGQTALIVYAADAFVVTPLTDDNATIANLVPALETSMMPSQGSNLSIAIAKASSLFNQAGIIKGDILVITDGIRQDDNAAIKKVSSLGFRLSIFGIGTTDGAPIPLANGFLQDSNGAIVIPKLQPAQLQKYALSAGGLYTGLHADDSDIEKLTQIFQSSEINKDDISNDLNADIWQEEGHWLLLPLLFLAALWARKGWIAVILIFILPLPQPAYAETTNTTESYLNTKYLWSSRDQQAMKAFNAGDNKSAANEFAQPDWKASAFYKNGDYQAAVDALKNTGHSDGFYNKANALAKLGNYKEAIKAYDKAIELDENNIDATYNREQVKQALQQQKSEQQDSQQDETDKEKSEQEKSEEEQSEQQQSEQNENQQQDSQSQDSDDEPQQDEQSEQQSENKSSEENQHQEEKELKQRDAEAEKEQQQKEQTQYEKNQQEQQEKSDEIENKESDEKPEDVEVNPIEASITEEEKATEQWLKRIPDDPGGLLRRKFLYQYNKTAGQNDNDEPW